jgi:hypothetical protein
MNKKILLLSCVLILGTSLLIAQKESTKKEKTKTEKTTAEKEVVGKNNLLFSKYKSAWQIGIFGGTSILMGDVKPALFSGSKPALPGHNYGIFVSKSWTYLFSTRLKYNTFVMFTNDAAASTLTTNQYSYLEERSSGLNGYRPGDIFFHNSRTQGHEANLDFVFSIGNINFHKDRSSVIFKVFPSLGFLMYQTFYDHLDANGDAYDYASIENLNNLESTSRKDVYKALANMRDGKYETRAEEHTVDDQNKFLKYNPRFTFGLGAGIAIRVTKFMSIDIETRQMLTRDDLIDGMQWQEPEGKIDAFSRNRTNGFDSYNQTTLGLTFSLIGKNIAESKNMDNPFAGDAFSKKNSTKTSLEEEEKLAEKAEMDSVNEALNEKVESLEEQINNLEILMKMLAESKNNPSVNADELAEEQRQLEAEAERLKKLNQGDQPENTDEDNDNLQTADDLNNVDDKTFRHRNGDYIYVADLQGDIKAAYYLIIGSFEIKGNALKDQRSWTDKGIKTVLMTDVKSGLYRLVVDYTNDHPAALDMLDKYKTKLNKEIWLIKAK